MLRISSHQALSPLHSHATKHPHPRIMMPAAAGTASSQPPDDEQPTPTPAGAGAGAGRYWSELPLDALVLVFARLGGPVDILMGAGLVCHSWLQAAKAAPELWLSLDMANHKAVEELNGNSLRAMAKVAVDRAEGRLQVFLAKYFVTDGLLNYIAHSSRSWSPSPSPSPWLKLKRLSLVSCGEVTNKGFTELVARSPLLEELSLELCPRVGGRGAYEAAGAACPRLRSFSLRRECFRFSLNYPRRVAEALGIAAAMPQLRSLTLVSCNVNNDELMAVLRGCPRLEELCLRHCYKVIADDALRARCARIRTLTLP